MIPAATRIASVAVDHSITVAISLALVWAFVGFCMISPMVEGPGCPGPVWLVFVALANDFADFPIGNDGIL